MKTLQLNAELIEKKKKERAETSGTKPGDKVSTTTSSPTKPTKQPGKLKRILTRIATSPKRAIRWYAALPLKKKVLVTGIASIIIVAIGGSITYLIITRTQSGIDLYIPTDEITAKASSPMYNSKINIPVPGAPRDVENPINGDLYTAKEFAVIEARYPIAAMIENHVDVRPQSGYNSADLIYETLAEGGITRTMAIFWGKDVPEIGPIRSARQYFVEWLMPYDPLYMHIGYALTDDPRTNSGGTIYNYGVKSMDRYGTFWRNNSRYAPHNAYTSTELLYQKATEFGYTGTPGKITPWKFKKDAQLERRGSQLTASVSFFDRLNNGGLYNVKWIYDRDRNIFLRHHDSNPYTDANTGATVYAKNVILQRVNMTSSYDSGSRVIIDVISEGNAILLQDGKPINITWKKKDIHSRTLYFDSAGAEIELNRGITWIVGIPIDQGDVIIEQ